MLLIYDTFDVLGVADRRAFSSRIASDLWGCGVVRDAFDRPFLDGVGAPFISISHTSHYWAILGGNSPVGLDIELTSRRALHLLSKFGTDSELSLCTLAYPPNPALLLWCLKEAAYKRAGVHDLEFLSGIRLVRAVGNLLSVNLPTLQQSLELEWHIDTRFSDDLLVVRTL